MCSKLKTWSGSNQGDHLARIVFQVSNDEHGKDQMPAIESIKDFNQTSQTLRSEHFDSNLMESMKLVVERPPRQNVPPDSQVTCTLGLPLSAPDRGQAAAAGMLGTTFRQTLRY